ncbi:MAG: hypothetical protein WBA44_12205 [Mesorhizobium sp.]
MDLTFIQQLSPPMAALLGAVVGGGLALIGGAVMLFMLRYDFVRNSAVARDIFSRVNPSTFYFGLVAPVWAFVGAMFGYLTASGQ